MPLTANDIPKENIFGIGLHHSGSFFHIAKPRKPFIFKRAEALNMIGYMIAHARLQPRDIDAAVGTESPDPFRTSANGDTFMITGPKSPIFLMTRDESMILIGQLIRKGQLKPSEIDAAAIAIEERAAGQSIEDVAKLLV